jgi:oxygen-dependent protoporphyrinogen oxidase
VDYAVNPFVSGIFAGDPYRLLVDKTFPFLSGMEKKYGSVVKGFLKSKPGNGKKESIVFKSGSEKLIEAVAKEVNNVFYNAKVLSLKKNAGKFEVSYLHKQKVGHTVVDKVVITSPANVTADILREFNSQISDKISGINYCPMVKVFLGFKLRDIGHYPEGFGVLNPDCEKQFSLGTIWNSSINPLSCPSDHFLFTVMVGGVNNVENTKEDDKAIISRVSSELKRIYDIRYNPDFTYVHRIPNAIPQYDIQMNGLEAVVDQLEQEGIFICANWYKGASVSDCIKKSINLSESMNKEAELVLAV